MVYSSFLFLDQYSQTAPPDLRSGLWVLPGDSEWSHLDAPEMNTISQVEKYVPYEICLQDKECLIDAFFWND